MPVSNISTRIYKEEKVENQKFNDDNNENIKNKFIYAIKKIK